MILTLLTAAGDPAGLQVRRDGERLLMTHQTMILVARRGIRFCEIVMEQVKGRVSA